MGLDPNTAFLANAVVLNSRGFITVGPNYAASMPGVFAAGDVRAGSTTRVGAAVGEGISAMLVHLRTSRTTATRPSPPATTETFRLRTKQFPGNGAGERVEPALHDATAMRCGHDCGYGWAH